MSLTKKNFLFNKVSQLKGVGSKTSEEIYLMIFIHAVFILSGLVIAIMDYISGITKHHP